MIKTIPLAGGWWRLDRVVPGFIPISLFENCRADDAYDDQTRDYQSGSDGRDQKDAASARGEFATDDPVLWIR